MPPASISLPFARSSRSVTSGRWLQWGHNPPWPSAEPSTRREAAQRLKIPLPTVSRGVAELEDQLKARLLERSTRNLRLTECRGGGFRACPAEGRTQQSRRQTCLEPAVDGRGRFAAFRATEHLRHSARTGARRVPGVLPEHPGTGFWSPMGLSTLSLRGSIWCFAAAHLEIHRWSLVKS
jgi:hypothetical protein